jgi:hypothetical protein
MKGSGGEGRLACERNGRRAMPEQQRPTAGSRSGGEANGAGGYRAKQLLHCARCLVILLVAAAG